MGRSLRVFKRGRKREGGRGEEREEGKREREKREGGREERRREREKKRKGKLSQSTTKLLFANRKLMSHKSKKHKLGIRSRGLLLIAQNNPKFTPPRAKERTLKMED